MGAFDNLRSTQCNEDRFEFKCPYCSSTAIDVVPLDVHFSRERETHQDEFNRNFKIRSLSDALEISNEQLIECKKCGIVSSNQKQLHKKKLNDWLKKSGYKQETLKL